MKTVKLLLLALVSAFAFKTAASQNVLFNILTQNAGLVHKGKTTFLEVTVNNTDPTSFVGLYKLRVQISVPTAIASIPATGHVLPTNWTITSRNDTTIILSNGKDLIAAHDARTLLIAIRGNKIGGPSTITGQLSFSNGQAPGTAPGTLPGDNPADNVSTTTCKVVR